MAEISDPSRIPIFASLISNCCPAKASPLMNSDMVKPIPHRIETPQISGQVAWSGELGYGVRQPEMGQLSEVGGEADAHEADADAGGS